MRFLFILPFCNFHQVRLAFHKSPKTGAAEEGVPILVHTAFPAEIQVDG